jgi:hypothetical protein
MNLWPFLVTAKECVRIINRAWNLYSLNYSEGDHNRLVYVANNMPEQDLFKIPGRFGVLLCERIKIKKTTRLTSMKIGRKNIITRLVGFKTG